MMLFGLALAGVPGDQLDQRLRDWIRPALEAGRIHGVVVQWIRGPESFRHSYGAGFSGNSVFEIGSVSKAFTGELLAEAALRGEVALDDPLSRHLGRDAPRWTKKVTLLQLATHTAGLPRLPPGLEGGVDPYEDWDDAKLEAALAAIEPTPTGTSNYSNLGAALLGRILERASGKDYPTLLAERITGPLGMTNTDVDGAAPVQGHGSGGQPVAPWTLNAFDAAGGIHSTPVDLMKWVRAHFDPSAPTTGAMALATRAHHRSPGSDVGLLWHRNASMVWHNGETGGYHALVAFVPGSKAGVVVLSDTATELVDQVGFAALQLLEGMEPEPLQMRAAVEVPDHVLVALAGRYGPVNVVHERQALWLELEGQPRYRMWAAGPSRYYLLEAPVEITLLQGRMVFEQQGVPRQEWTRDQVSTPTRAQSPPR